jgi:peptidoglycan/xylan/chitin deacetylase (PgdA/CDA1 family)
MRATAAAGHEVGIHCHDHIRWQDYVARRGEAWTRREMEKAAQAFERVFGRRATVHGAAGWQVNAHALRFEQEMGFAYASDVRGTHPFLPVMDGQLSACPQLPTTLPTLDELIGRDGIGDGNVHDHVHAASLEPLANGHVYTLHAELEGMKLLPVMERLLGRWRAEGLALGPMETLYAQLDRADLPRHRVEWGTVEGRSGLLAVQGPPAGAA